MTRGRLMAAALLAGCATAVPPACDLTRSGDEVCDDYCNFRCGFYNTTRGETGDKQLVTIYRLTPLNVSGIRNKDTGDPPGDIGFWLSHKNMTQECAKDPQAMGCFLEGKNLYGKFVIEMDGQWGPYLQCNPEQLGGKDPISKPVWADDRNFLCGQDCLQPTATGCHSAYPSPQKNTTNDGSFGAKCYCNGTNRQHISVGRSEPAFLDSSHSWGKATVPKSWEPQCQQGYQSLPDGNCLEGSVSQELQAWSFESATSMACEACMDDLACTGWQTKDNRTVQLFRGNLTISAGDCVAATAFNNSWSKQKGWYGVGALGGFWYSTPVGGECADGVPLGTDGCTWRQVSSVYKNATCVDGMVDASVERFGIKCFNDCSQPLNRTSDCYLNCYRFALMGYAGMNLTKIPLNEVVDPWVLAFSENDPSKGGCPAVQPAPCEGNQCDPMLPPSRLSIVI